MIGIEGTYALNGGRGRTTLQCMWSIHRIDSQLGRYLDINSAWRDPREQEKLYTAYRNYVNGNGPWAPIALPPEQSVHCKGEAIDTDDNNSAMTQLLNRNGWFHTVYRDGKLVEPWHYEYDYKRDQFFGTQQNTPAGSGSTPFNAEEEELMAALDEIRAMIDATNKNLVERTQAQHDVSRTYLRDQTQKQHDVTRSYLGDLGQKQHDVTRGYIVDTTGEKIDPVMAALTAISNRLTAIEARLPKA